MATFVVGGIECTLDERELALGHVVIPLADVVSFGLAREPAEIVFVYRRRGPDSGYRDRDGGPSKPITMKIPAHGEVGALVALLRERVPQAWRGEHESPEVVLGERPPTPPPRPLPWKRIGLMASIVIVISWIAFLWVSSGASYESDRDRTPPRRLDAGAVGPPRQ